MNKSDVKVIKIPATENEELVKMIERVEGVSVVKDRNGYKIFVYERVVTKSPVGIVIKNKKRKRLVDALKPVFSGRKADETNFVAQQSSSIIAKQMV